MLVLSRKQNEKICIGEEITVTVVKLKGNRVRIGIEAPNHIQVLRGELTFEMPNTDRIESRSEKITSDKRSQRLASQPMDSSYLAKVAGLDTAEFDTAGLDVAGFNTAGNVA